MSVWREPPSATIAGTIAAVRDGIEALALGGCTETASGWVQPASSGAASPGATMVSDPVLAIATQMNKILTLAFLLLGLQQLSAQPFPFYYYDLSYYDSPKCIKEKANSFGKSTLIPNKPDEAVGKSICQVAKAAARSSRQDMAKRWDAIPSGVRWKCIVSFPPPD